MSGNFEVAVVGAGVFGSWTAFHLARAGTQVVLVDAYGPGHARASSGGESRIIRMGYGADEIYTRFSVRSLVLWRQFFDPFFIQTGVLWVAPEQDRRTLDTRQTLEAFGVATEILSAADLAKRYPQMQFDRDTWGILEPESGALLARRAVQAVADESVRSGAVYRREAIVAPEGSRRLDAIRTQSGDVIRAEKFVFACGPWLPKLFPDLLGGRILPTRQEVFFFGTPAGDWRFSSPAMPAWIEFAGPHSSAYGFPDIESRGLKLAFDAHGEAFDPDSGNRHVTQEGLAAARGFLAERFPALRDAPLVESRVCQYENTSSGDFVIDRHPAFDNVWLAGGGSGHGFKHGPAVGEYVAARISGSGPEEQRFLLASKEQLPNRTVY